ncbi:hypothetical protein GE061_000474 [Apolygus lucorum]|uniref:Uncharacterized protein n=1 Tax=Apolygus lucorum TaxID=248454 RepID=A0A8S9Y8T8_APOLU|nr:hypothetical protein GE061_000474 [Apolygus lucorum]
MVQAEFSIQVIMRLITPFMPRGRTTVNITRLLVLLPKLRPAELNGRQGGLSPSGALVLIMMSVRGGEPLGRPALPRAPPPLVHMRDQSLR